MSTLNNVYSRKVRDVYLELIQKFPLRPIRSDDELSEAVHIIDSLLDRPELDPAEQDYLEVLSDLVHSYESEQHPILPASDAEVLRHLIQSKGRAQADVAKETGIAESTISEVLGEKRALNRSHIGKLSGYFHVNPSVFRFGE